MVQAPQPPTAVHLPGGNYFDDVRLDIAESITRQRDWRSGLQKQIVNRSTVANRIALKRFLLTARAGARDALVNNSLERAWFGEFQDWWHNAVQGRPLTVSDFLALRFHYRTRAQHIHAMDWSTQEKHLENWQSPDNINAIFQFVYRDALWPLRSPLLFDAIQKGTRVLEYGCSVAPMYRTWRQFMSDRAASWVLADIPNFPFHYAGHIYARDNAAEFAYIEDFSDPLRDVQGSFDLIIVQEVFEHLDAPSRVARQLVERLAPGGALLFDYPAKDVDSVAGHDTSAGASQRIETLEYLAEVLDLGEFQPSAETVALRVARRRP